MEEEGEGGGGVRGGGIWRIWWYMEDVFTCILIVSRPSNTKSVSQGRIC